MKSAQRVLRGAAGYRGEIDGKANAEALTLALRILARALPANVVTPELKVIAAAQALLAQGGFDPGPVDGRWGPSTDAAFLAWRGDVLPVRGVDLAGRLGPAGGPQCTRGEIRVPWRMVLAWDQGQAVSTIRCHELVAPSAQRAFERIAGQYNQAQIKDLGLDQFGGCYNYRPKRGGTALSTHAYGAAIDFDPVRNQLTWGKDKARLALPDAVPFWLAWEAEGWVSLGRAKNFDWMHVQAVAA